MKNCISIIALFLVALSSTFAQGPAIITEELCWTLPDGSDSTLIGYYLYSSTQANPARKNYIDASGNPGAVTGGTVRVGACMKEEEVGSRVFVKMLSRGEDYSLPIDTLEAYDFLFIYMRSDPIGTVDTSVVTLPERAFSLDFMGKNIYFHASHDLASDTSRLPCIIRTPNGPGFVGSHTQLLQTDCYSANTTENFDTLLVSYDYQRVFRYQTSLGQEYVNYIRECTGSIVSLADIPFDSDRDILRMWEVGDNVGGSTVGDFLEYLYSTPPTISSNIVGTSLFEIGTSNTVDFRTVLSNPAGIAFTNYEASEQGKGVVATFPPGSQTSRTDVFQFTYAPVQSPVGGVGVYDDDEYRFSSELTYDGTETATSNTSIIRAVYPIFSGVVADTAVAFADVYGELNKSVQREGDKTISFTGTGIAVYGFPASWSDTVINQILDPNGLNATSAFTRLTT